MHDLLSPDLPLPLHHAAPARRRLYHHHLKKCGGTSLNTWLDTLAPDDRTFQDSWIATLRADRRPGETSAQQGARHAARARALFHWADIVRTHEPLHRHAPAGTLRFTILRDPIARLISQVMDWRRLRPEHLVAEPLRMRALIADAQALPLRAFLERHGEGNHLLDNYLTRSLAAARVPLVMHTTAHPAHLLDAALGSLAQDFDLVGTTEHLTQARRALCARLGLPPASAMPALNTAPLAPAEGEVAAAARILAGLTRWDAVLHARARDLFAAHHHPLAETYDHAAFESRHAAQALAELRGDHHDGATRYSVRAPLIAAGLHGRDSPGTPACAVWSGPAPRATLYIPAIAHADLCLLVWIRGYAAPRQRAQLRARVDGQPAPHHFEPEAGYADRLAIRARPARDFVRLDLDLDETLASPEPASEGGDPRPRGLCLASYGWRPA